jgi:DNA replication protein DnaC
LFDEVVPLGYAGSYVSFARQLRKAGLRPHCEACSGVSGRDTIEIDHPAGEEMQWDWFERRKAPWGGTAYVLLGTLPHSSRVRGVLAESLDQPHLIEGIDAVLRRYGGTPRIWRTDRLATVIVPGRRDVQPSFAPVAKHYGAIVEPCPPRRGNRKGAVESSVRYLCGRWWRTMTATSPEDAQRSLDTFCAGPGDVRTRATAGGPVTVAALAEAEPLLGLPAAPFPATVQVSRTVADNAAVPFRGNSYSVPPGLGGQVLGLSHRLGSSTVEIASPTGEVLVSHRLAPAGAGALVRTPAHRAELERVVLSAFTTARPCERKANRPPGESARAEAAKLLSGLGSEVVVDLAGYGERQHPRQHQCCPRGGPVSQSSTYQQLRGHLAALKLSAAAEALPAQLDHASKEKLGHTAFLERLLAIEVTAAGRRRQESLARFACLPAPWQLSDYDFDAQASVDRALVTELGTLRFLEDATNVLLIGPPGVGKTMLAVGFGHAAVAAGYRTYYTTATDLVARCHRAALEGRWATCMRFFAGPRLLIIDELGYLPMAGEAAAALFQVITQRYLKGSIVLTTNLGVPSWGRIFNDDPMVAAAMLDRLLHRSVVFNISGESYRMRTHRARADKLRAATGTTS